VKGAGVANVERRESPHQTGADPLLRVRELVIPSRDSQGHSNCFALTAMRRRHSEAEN
jgi:hypothetical protein